ncbi:MAG: PhoH family protein [Candidatus Omnitrophica bacterium]|nr:PhoH family protein [Candidatus Omnitrophota bacterium]
MAEQVIRLRSEEEAIKLYGNMDEHLRYAEDRFRVKVSARNFRLRIVGKADGVEQAVRYFQSELDLIRGRSLKSLGHLGELPHSGGLERRDGKIHFVHKGKEIRPKTPHQERYLQAVLDNDIVFSIGPAGTGKTFLAMALAIYYLRARKLSRIVLTRPAVEAGESLGFLPGDYFAKINPYLRPLYDALYEMMEFDEASRLIERGVIEVAPLAYMRGRTLNDAFIILDEAQNTTRAQMKMFLTRLGATAKAVITGDITQIDLGVGTRSGLLEAQDILKGIRGIKFSYLTHQDVVRHKLVQSIINAYEKFTQKG